MYTLVFCWLWPFFLTKMIEKNTYSGSGEWRFHSAVQRRKLMKDFFSKVCCLNDFCRWPGFSISLCWFNYWSRKNLLRNWKLLVFSRLCPPAKDKAVISRWKIKNLSQVSWQGYWISQIYKGLFLVEAGQIVILEIIKFLILRRLNLQILRRQCCLCC